MFINMTNDPGKYHLACPDWNMHFQLC